MTIKARKMFNAFKAQRPQWYEIKAAAKGARAEVFIYDEIGFFGITAQDFIRDFKAIEADKITVRINSPGGDVFDGLAIYNAIRGHRAQVQTRVEGLAASMASIIALAGDEIVMVENTFMMIHNPWTIAIGDKNDMRDAADRLEKVGGQIVHIYQDKTGMDREEIQDMLDDETWLDPEDALTMGFVDSVVAPDEAVAASMRKPSRDALDGFKNPPADLAAQVAEKASAPVNITKIEDKKDDTPAQVDDLERRRLAARARLAGAAD